MFVTLRYDAATGEDEEAGRTVPRRSRGYEEALVSLEGYLDTYKNFAPGVCPPNNLAIEENWLEDARIVSDRLSLLKETYKAIQAAKRRLHASRADDSSLKPLAANESSPDLDDNEPATDTNPALAIFPEQDFDLHPLASNNAISNGLPFKSQNFDSDYLANLLQGGARTSDVDERSTPSPRVDPNLHATVNFDTYTEPSV